MKRDAKCVVLVDSDEDDVRAFRESVRNLAVLNRYDYDQLERKIILEKRLIVLISADPDPMVAISMALFAATKPVIRIGVLSATNSLPPDLTDTPFTINSALTFFSNGKERGLLVDRPQADCGLCGGTGSIMLDPIAEDVCPRCGYTERKGKNWMQFIQTSLVKGPIRFPVSIFLE